MPAKFKMGDLFVAEAGAAGAGRVQQRTKDAKLIRVLETGQGNGIGDMALDRFNRLYTPNVAPNTVSKFDSAGRLLGLFGTGYDANPQSLVFDRAGNLYAGETAGQQGILKLSPTGAPVTRFTVALEANGVRSLDLAPDQATMFYTSEGGGVKRFHVATNTQMPDFNVMPLPGQAQGIKVLPDGGALVADLSQIIRLDAMGDQVQSYGLGLATGWANLALDPGGTSFWAGDFVSGLVARFDIGSGAVLLAFLAGFGVGGLAVSGRGTAAFLQQGPLFTSEGPCFSGRISRPFVNRARSL